MNPSKSIKEIVVLSAPNHNIDELSKMIAREVAERPNELPTICITDFAHTSKSVSVSDRLQVRKMPARSWLSALWPKIGFVKGRSHSSQDLRPNTIALKEGLLRAALGTKRRIYVNVGSAETIGAEVILFQSELTNFKSDDGRLVKIDSVEHIMVESEMAEEDKDITEQIRDVIRDELDSFDVKSLQPKFGQVGTRFDVIDKKLENADIRFNNVDQKLIGFDEKFSEINGKIDVLTDLLKQSLKPSP